MKNDFGLYMIITDPLLSYQEISRIAVKQGVRYLQLREKNKTDRDLIAISREILKITNKTETKFIMNDRADLARIVKADGLHLGQTDISLADAKEIFGHDKIYGLSTHSLSQFRQASELNPTYLGFGPIYPTPTKSNPDPVVGLEQLSQVAKIANLPFLAIGGIDDKNLPDVIASGAKNIACVRYLMNSRDLEARIIKLKQELQAKGKIK